MSGWEIGLDALAIVGVVAVMLWFGWKFQKAIGDGLEAWADRLRDRSELERDRLKIYNDGWQAGRAVERQRIRTDRKDLPEK